MASTRKLNTKDGTPFYEISVSRGRGIPRLTTRWYPPVGWSQKAIDRKRAGEAVAADLCIDWTHLRHELRPDQTAMVC